MTGAENILFVPVSLSLRIVLLIQEIEPSPFNDQMVLIYKLTLKCIKKLSEKASRTCIPPYALLYLHQ